MLNGCLEEPGSQNRPRVEPQPPVTPVDELRIPMTPGDIMHGYKNGVFVLTSIYALKKTRASWSKCQQGLFNPFQVGIREPP